MAKRGCLRNRPHLEAEKLGENGVSYIVCERCGETLRRAETSPPCEAQHKNYKGKCPYCHTIL